MPLFVALIAAIVLGERISIARRLGLALILAGALVIMVWHAIDRSIAWNASRTFGDALFLCAAFMTASFTVVMRRAKLEPLHAAALVSTGSLVMYLPIQLQKALHAKAKAEAGYRFYALISWSPEHASLRYRSPILRCRRFSRAF